MKDTLVNFETAILAKEKGFDEYCNNLYCKDKYLYNDNDCFKNNTSINNLIEYRKELQKKKPEYDLSTDELCVAPTQSLLQRWLREIHNIHICGEVRWNNFEKKELIYEFWIKDMRDVNPSKRIFTKPSTISYEEALEVALKDGLQLITSK